MAVSFSPEIIRNVLCEQFRLVQSLSRYGGHDIGYQTTLEKDGSQATLKIFSEPLRPKTKTLILSSQFTKMEGLGGGFIEFKHIFIPPIKSDWREFTKARFGRLLPMQTPILPVKSLNELIVGVHTDEPTKPQTESIVEANTTLLPHLGTKYMFSGIEIPQKFVYLLNGVEDERLKNHPGNQERSFGSYCKSEIGQKDIALIHTALDALFRTLSPQ